MLERLDRLIGFRWLYTRYRQFVTGGVFLKTQECPVDEIERYKRGANAMQVGGRHYMISLIRFSPLYAAPLSAHAK